MQELNGLNLLNDKSVWCHYKKEDNAAIKKIKEDLYILYEESGIYINDNQILTIGKLYLNKAEI